MTDPNIIIRAINDATDAAHALRAAARNPRRGTSEPVTGGPIEAPAPISLDLFDQAELIHYCIQGWAKICEEEKSDPLPRDETAPLAQYLLHHTGWISEQSWADDLVTELRDHTHTAESMLGLLPRRIPLPTPCECGAQQWGYPSEGEGGMQVECAEGHAKTLHQAAGGARLSIRGAQRALGIRRVTIREALESGRVTNHGSPARPILDTSEIQSYLTERLRTHSL